MSDLILVSELTPALRAAICNGCGPHSWKFKGHTWRSKWFAIATPGGSAACNQHDLDYWIGGTEADRHAADLRMRDTMIAEANKRWFLARWLLRSEAHLFYRLVDTEGGTRFRHGPKRTRDDLNAYAQKIAKYAEPPPPPPRNAA